MVPFIRPRRAPASCHCPSAHPGWRPNASNSSRMVALTFCTALLSTTVLCQHPPTAGSRHPTARSWPGDELRHGRGRSQRELRYAPREQGGEQLAFRGERACRNAASPALGGEAAPIASPSSASYTEVAGFGAALQPSGGQAPSPQGGEQLAFCGERACPALGGEAAPIASPRSASYTEVAVFGAALQPSGGQAPSPHPEKTITRTVPAGPSDCGESDSNE